MQLYYSDLFGLRFLFQNLPPAETCLEDFLRVSLFFPHVDLFLFISACLKVHCAKALPVPPPLFALRLLDQGYVLKYGAEGRVVGFGSQDLAESTQNAQETAKRSVTEVLAQLEQLEALQCFASG